MDQYFGYSFLKPQQGVLMHGFWRKDRLVFFLVSRYEFVKSNPPVVRKEGGSAESEACHLAGHGSGRHGGDDNGQCLVGKRPGSRADRAL
jgi:hypothetical protein